MAWREDHDVLLCREVIANDPFEAKKALFNGALNEH